MAEILLVFCFVSGALTLCLLPGLIMSRRAHGCGCENAAQEYTAYALALTRLVHGAIEKDAQIATLKKELARATDSAEWRLKRLDLLQSVQHNFAEPERTVVCDILANGSFLPDPDGKRYGGKATPRKKDLTNDRS